MAATGLQVNWTGVAFGEITLDRVTNVSFSENAENIRFKADNARYPQVIVNVNNGPVATVTTGNIGLALTLAVNSQALFTATHKDARGQVGGDIVYEMPSILTSRDHGGAHAAFGQASLGFEGVSPDGQTNPVAFSRV